MTKKIAILNFKGGVAKTTTAVNICAALAKENKKVLLIDLDGQCDSTFLLDFKVGDGSTIFDSMKDEFLSKNMEIFEFKENFDFVPASTELDTADRTFPNLPMTENRLKMLIQPYENDYDYVIIDCPPNNGVLTNNALTAANYVIVPVTGDDFAMKGIAKITHQIEATKKMLNPELDLLGFVFTIFDGRTKIHNDAVELLEKTYPGKVFDRKIRTCVKLRQLPAVHLTIFEHAPYSTGAFDYKALTDEIIDALENN